MVVAEGSTMAEDDRGYVLDHVSVLWVTVKVAVADDDGKAVEDNVAREVDILAVVEEDVVGLDDGNTVAANVNVMVQPIARCEMLAAQG